MFPQRTMFRAAAALRSPATRSAFQRRFASIETSGLHGAEDNAFNRERKAVKDHAAATSGEWAIMGWLSEIDTNNLRSLAQVVNLVRQRFRFA